MTGSDDPTTGSGGSMAGSDAERTGSDGEKTGSDGRRPWLLVIDTATSQIVVAAASVDGSLIASATWEAGRTHGALLLPTIGRLTGEANLRRSRIAAVIVGTGPGAFTGLRVGLATAKAIAHELRVPIVGVSTGDALLASSAIGARAVLLLPAGPNDRHLVRSGAGPVLLPGGQEPDPAPDEVVVAVDLEGRATDAELARGAAARDGLAATLARQGAARLRDGAPDDLARLVPEYVSLPRGVTSEQGEVAWSRDPR